MKEGLKKKIFLLFLGIGAIVFLNFFQSQIKNFFYYISSPFQQIFLKGSNFISDFFESVVMIKKQREENEKLHQRIQQLLAENAKLKAIEEENKILREFLKINPQKEFEFFISYLVSRDITSEDTILIKGGLEDGIEKEMPVITPEKVLVGKVEEVFKNFSRVKLISRKNFSFNVKILREDPIYGIAKGKGNLSLTLERVLLDAEIKEKDILITTTLREISPENLFVKEIFPKNLLVGEIIKVKKTPLEPFQIAEVSPFFKTKNLDTLFIITKW